MTNQQLEPAYMVVLRTMAVLHRLGGNHSDLVWIFTEPGLAALHGGANEQELMKATEKIKREQARRQKRPAKRVGAAPGRRKGKRG